MTRPRSLRALGIALLGALGLLGCNDFGQPEVYVFDLEATGEWPDAAAPTDTIDLPLSVTVGNAPTDDVALRWDVSDSTLFRIIDDTADPVRGTALGEGGPVEITVRAVEPGTETNVVRHTINLIPLSIQPVTADSVGAWPAVVTLSGRDTVTVSVFRANNDTVAIPTLRWRSSDPEVLGVTQVPVAESDSTPELESLASRTAVIAGRRLGSAEIVVGIELNGAETRDLRIQVSVDTFSINREEWPDTLRLPQDMPFVLDIRDAGGAPMQGLEVDWTSTDLNVVTVAATGGDSTVLSARGAGPAEIMAVIDPEGFESTEITIPVEVLPLILNTDVANLSGAVDSTFMVARDTVLATVQISDLLTDSQGEYARGLPVVWSSSDPSVEIIPIPPTGNSGADTLAAQLSVKLFGTQQGRTEITAVVGEPGPNSQFTITTAVEVLERWADISVGGQHICGINWASELYCWGRIQDRSDENLGVGAGVWPLEESPVHVGSDYRSVASGLAHACAIKGNVANPSNPGPVFCWGANNFGQIGNGTADNAITPTQVLGGFAFKSIDADERNTCGVASDDRPRCWGRSLLDDILPSQCQTAADQPCDPVVDTTFQPDATVGGQWIGAGNNLTRERANDVAVGERHVCISRLERTKCWGQRPGSLNRTYVDLHNDTLTMLDSTLDFRTLAAGEGFTCGITWGSFQGYGSAHCWGGRFGSEGSESATPVPMTPGGGTNSWRQISAGGTHACGVTRDYEGFCWGQRALGGPSSTASPSRVDTSNMVGDTRFTMISAGPRWQRGDNSEAIQVELSCGISTNGVAYCWGFEDVAVNAVELFDISDTPTRVPRR